MRAVRRVGVAGACGFAFALAPAPPAGALGVADYRLNCVSFAVSNSAPDAISYSATFPAGGGAGFAAGASIGSLGPGRVPRIELAGRLDLSGVGLGQFQQCSYAVGVVQDTLWSSLDSSDPTDTSPVSALLRISLTNDITLDVTQGTAANVRANVGILVSGAASANAFGGVDGAGGTTTSPLFGFDLTDLSMGSQIHWTIGGDIDVPVMLPRNQSFSLALTNFQEIIALNSGAVPETFSFSAEVGSGSLLDWSIVSLDPDVAFTSAVPEPPLAGLLAAALLAAAAARRRASLRRG
jgi:hypothetical protein